jgi:hypothetical protein
MDPIPFGRQTPRPEAGVIRASQLTDGQQQAGRSVVELITSMADAPEERTQPSSGLHDQIMPALDSQRSSRVVLIDGRPGSGKTTLLMTLLQHFREAIVAPEKADESCPWPSVTPARILPVGLIELHLVPASTNPIVHLAAPLHRTLEVLQPEAQSLPAPWHPAATHEPDALTRWRHFLAAAAAAWEGNLRQRREHLDAEAYAFELETTERRRLDVTVTFRAFVDALLVDLGRFRVIGSVRPLLVLAIDDADLHAQLSVDVLFVLQALYHPRVAFVMSGDSRVFLQTLQAHFIGKLCHSLRGVAQISKSYVANQERDALARARGAYDRTVPPAQRPVLRSLSADSTWEGVRPLLATVEVKTIEQWPNLLGEFIDLVPQVREALPDTMRGVIDLRHALEARRQFNDPTDPRRVRLVGWVVDWLWNRSIEEAGLAAEDEAVLRSVVKIDRECNLVVDPNPLEFALPQTFLLYLKAVGGGRVIGSRVRDLYVRLKHTAGSDASDLPEAIAAAFLLAAMIALDAPQYVLNVYESVRQQPFDGAFMCVDRPVDEFGQLEFGWALPNGMIFLDLFLFARQWEQVIGTDREVSHDIDGLARTFLQLLIGIAGDRHTSFSPNGQVGMWEELAADLHRLGTSERSVLRSTRHDAFRRWAAEIAGLLAAPESGLGRAGAEALLGELSKKWGKEWEEVRRSLCASREARARRALGKRGEEHPENVAKVLKAIDAKERDHPWVRLVGRTELAMAVAGYPTAESGVGHRESEPPRAT